MKEIVKSNGLKFFVDLASLAHLHTNRAYIPTQVKNFDAFLKKTIVTFFVSD